MKSLLNTAEAAQFLRRTPKTIYRMVKDGRLQARRLHVNSPLLFTEDDLLAAIGIEPEKASSDPSAGDSDRTRMSGGGS